MKTSIDFLKSIGHSERVHIRCLAPKNTPLSELEARGMTYQDKSGQTKKSTVNGYIDPQTGELYRRYGKEYNPVTDGWGHLLELNQQGYGVYCVVGHGGERNSDITHGSTLFHESDRATLEQQQLEIDRISSEFGKPTAVVQTKKSLHAYWASSETIAIDSLPTYQRRWLQYSNCDDSSLSDPAQLMRLPGFDHVAWNGTDFDRVRCELLQQNEVSYPLAEFDRILPALDVDRYCKQSVAELTESDADDRDMRSFAQYLPGFDSIGKWMKAKCPAHDGESSDSLHIDSETGGFICHAGCSSSAVYNATKAVAVANGHRFEVVSLDAELSQNLKESLNLKNGKAPNLFGGELGKLLSIAAGNFNIPVEILNFCLLPILGSRINSATRLMINPGTSFDVPPIRWSGLVGDSGTKKSPIIGLLTKPMNKKQLELYEDYKEKKLAYDAEFIAWKAQKPADRGEPPQAPTPMLDLYFSNFTIEALIDSLQHHPTEGTLISVDELSQFFTQMDMYRGGKGSDRSQYLSAYNGDSFKTNRKSSGAVCVPNPSISILGGIQPQTITNMIEADPNHLDGLYFRMSFVGLPNNKMEAFTEIGGDLGDALYRLYEAISTAGSQQHFLSLEAKPLWANWYDMSEDKQRSTSSTNLMKGIYSKFQGIAGRNALIIHRTMTAIAGVVPDQLISASTMEKAIAWTQWELSQTLLQYQLLGLTNDPELSRILKFIDKFSGKGWVNARDVDRWWSARTKPPANELREFMAKVVKLGHAIDNDEPIESSKYRIQINRNGSDSSDKNPVNVAEKQTRLSLAIVKNLSPEAVKHSHNGDSEFVTTTRSIGGDKSENRQDIQTEFNADEFVTNFAPNGGDKPETSLNGHQSQQSTNSVTTFSDRINNIHINSSSDSVTTVTTISNKNIFKIGDRAKLGDDIITIEKIEDDFIGGISDDGSYIGGSIDSFRIVSDEIHPTPKGEIELVPIGDGFVEIVRKETTIAEGEIEYEC
jgi:Protein of unknown function (DUF3987)